MPINFTAKQEYVVGDATVVEGAAPSGHFVVIFEDDGDTGYFYALDTSAKQQPIQDAVHIYNVEKSAGHRKTAARIKLFQEVIAAGITTIGTMSANKRLQPIARRTRSG